MWGGKMTGFATRKEIFRPLINAERWLMAMLATGAVTGTFLPVMFPSQIPEVKLIENIAGLVSGAVFTVSALERSRKEQDYQANDMANHALVKEGLKREFTVEKRIQEIETKRDLAAYINKIPSVEERTRLAAQYGLQGFVDLPQVQQAVIEQPSKTPQLKPVFNGTTQSSIDSISDDLAAPVDYTWMDAPFVIGSKVVYGPKGSGKSIYLAYEAIAFLTHFPNGELRIGDRHYDKDKSVWLPGIPPDVLLKLFVAKKSEDILNAFRRAKQLLNYRIENGIKEGHSECKPFKFICDEFEGVMTQFSDTEKAEVMSIITQTQDEGRKYLINITLGTHSLKEKRIGIDSSVLFQMDILCLGTALADPVTKWPADIEAKKLLVEQMELQRTLKKHQGFACVVRKLGEMAGVEVIPFLDLNQFSFEYEPEDTPKTDQKETVNPYQTIKNWIKQLGRNPTDSELTQAWQQVKGETLTPDALKLLKNALELTDEVVTWSTITANIELPEKWKEEDLQKAIASRLTEYGYEVKLEVGINGGFADIVTNFDGGTIIEVKKYLERKTILEASGQLANVYGLGNEYKLLVAGFLPNNEGDQAQAKTTASMVSQNPRINVLFIG